MRRPVLFLAAAFTLVSACHSSKSALEPMTLEVDGMNNSVVVGDLMIGGQPSAEALHELADAGYRSVVSVRGESEIDWDEQSAVEALGMSFLRIEMTNPVNEITDEQVASFARFMEERDGPAVLHCGSGNRVAGLWAAWLIDYKGVAVKDAIRAAKAAGMRDSMEAVVERRVAE